MTTLQTADIRLDLSPDRRGLQIEFAGHGQKLVGFTLEAPELDRLIALLGAARAGMADEVPAQLDPGSRVPATVAPAWQAPDPGVSDTCGLALRHPGFGWLGFVLPRHQAHAIAAALDRRDRRAAESAIGA